MRWQRARSEVSSRLVRSRTLRVHRGAPSAPLGRIGWSRRCLRGLRKQACHGRSGKRIPKEAPLPGSCSSEVVRCTDLHCCSERSWARGRSTKRAAVRFQRSHVVDVATGGGRSSVVRTGVHGNDFAMGDAAASRPLRSGWSGRERPGCPRPLVLRQAQHERTRESLVPQVTRPLRQAQRERRSAPASAVAVWSPSERAKRCAPSTRAHRLTPATSSSGRPSAASAA